MTLAVEITDIRDAARVIDGIANHTPALRFRDLDDEVGARLILKCENFQRVGAFKFRGAYNALSRLDDDTRVRGVLTFSSGNHAQAVALASRLLGIDAVIIMPTDAPRVKLDATRALLEGTPGRVVEYDRREMTREELGRQMLEETGRTLIPPYDHPHVIAGQGTAGLELFGQVEFEEGFDGGLDYLFVCCGGGGLLSGCATVARALCPECKVIGVEPEAADDATRSFRTGTLQTVKDPPTIADGARTPSLGRHTFPIVMERVDDMMTVTDDELISAMHQAVMKLKLVVEPTGVLALAGAIQRRREIDGTRVGIVISGGNVDPSRLASVIAG